MSGLFPTAAAVASDKAAKEQVSAQEDKKAASPSLNFQSLVMQYYSDEELTDLKVLGKRNQREWEPNAESRDEDLGHSFSRLAIKKRYEAWKA
jgi:hypothetical protein